MRKHASNRKDKNMDYKTYQPQMPDIMEAVFDAVYLLFDLVAGIVFFTMAQGRPLFVLYGILTLTLCGGDAFHLVPRIFRAFPGSSGRSVEAPPRSSI